MPAFVAPTEPMTLVVAVKHFFSYSSARSFMEEWKKLTPQDKADFKAGLEANGYKIKQATIGE